MTPTFRDYDDFSPPNLNTQERLADEFVGTVAAGDAQLIAVAPDGIDNVVMLNVLVPASCALELAPNLDGDGYPSARWAVNATAGDRHVSLPLGSLAQGFALTLYNGGSVDWAYDVVVSSFAGVSAQLVSPANLAASPGKITVAGSSSSDALDVPQAFLYDRATVTVAADHACKVHALWAFVEFDSGWTIGAVDEVIATLAGAGAVTVDVPIGGFDMAVVLEATTASSTIARLITRVYRGAGF